MCHAYSGFAVGLHVMTSTEIRQFIVDDASSGQLNAWMCVCVWGGGGMGAGGYEEHFLFIYQFILSRGCNLAHFMFLFVM